MDETNENFTDWRDEYENDITLTDAPSSEEMNDSYQDYIDSQY